MPVDPGEFFDGAIIRDALLHVALVGALEVVFGLDGGIGDELAQELGEGWTISASDAKHRYVPDKKCSN